MIFIAIADQEQARAEAGHPISTPSSPTHLSPPTPQTPQTPQTTQTYTAEEYRAVKAGAVPDIELDQRAEEIKKESKEKYSWLVESGR